MHFQPFKAKVSRFLASIFVLGFSLSGFAQETVFTYQGRLNDNGQPANGTYDLTFTLYDSTNVPGNVLAGTITNLSTAVTSGLFSVNLDFGNVFDGSARWVGIGVRTNGAVNFSTLSPRQPLTAVPYAIFAGATTNLVGPLTPQNIAPVTALVASSSNSLYSAFNSGAGTNFANSRSGGIISTNEYAKLNSYPGAFDIIAPLPPVMINTWWWQWGGNGDEITTNTMHYLATNGVLAMAKKYNTPFYYVMDDYWMDRTNVPDGILQPDPILWPHGMKVIADTAHSLGMKYGIYPQSAAWGIFPTNLVGNATNFIAWGIDYLKFELGSQEGPDRDLYLVDTLLAPFWAAGRPVFVESGCNGWSPSYMGVVQSPRCILAGDVYSYYNLMVVVDYTRTFSPFTIGPGRGFFPSIDYVNDRLSEDMEREHWTAEAMIPSVWAFSFSTNEISHYMPSLTNEDVFSINQDPLVSPGFLVSSNNLVNVYERRCVSNTVAVSIENRNFKTTNYTVWFTNLTGVSGTYLVRDCWARTNSVAKDSVTIQVNGYSAALLRLTPAFDATTNILAVNWPGSMVTSVNFNGVQTIGYAPLDVDTSNYIARAGIMGNPSEMLAAAVAVSLGKSHGWWTNWDALYLFRGSTPASTAQNLVSSNYAITWNTNGMTFGWAGVTGDGTNSFGDTHFNPATVGSSHYALNSASVFVYNRTPAPVGGTAGFTGFIGSAGSPGAGLYGVPGSHILGMFGMNAPGAVDNVNVYIEGPPFDFTGFLLGNRYAANAQTVFQNQYTGNTIDATLTTGLPNRSFYIFGVNNGALAYPSGCTLSLAGLGAGMSAGQWQVFQNDLKTAMSVLGL